MPDMLGKFMPPGLGMLDGGTNSNGVSVGALVVVEVVVFGAAVVVEAGA